MNSLPGTNTSRLVCQDFKLTSIVGPFGAEMSGESVAVGRFMGFLFRQVAGDKHMIWATKHMLIWAMKQMLIWF